MRLSSLLGRILFCVTAFVSVLYSQTRIEGVVTDNGGQYLGGGAEPVVGARVEVADQSDPSRTRRFSGETDSQGRYSITIPETGIGERSAGSPASFGLSQNYPNPFNPSTVIAYELAKPAEIRIDIHDLFGRKISTLLSGYRTEGEGRVVWDGTDESGRCVPAGVYVYSLAAEGTKISRKMLLLDGGMSPSISGLSKRSTSVHKRVRAMSDLYCFRFSGTDIETLERTDVQITGPTVLDVTVIRTVTDIDGNVYRTVKIGSQVWTVENLKVTKYRNGDPIPNVTRDSAWKSLTAGAYCDYENDSGNVPVFGRLYHWYAVSDSRGIAPAGWHVPTDAEWQTLINYLGGESGTSGKMKEAGTTHWDSPNIGATNESGFTALPGGYRSTNGEFVSLRRNAHFWSSSTYDSDYAWFVYLVYENSDAYRSYDPKQHGNSVRLVKD